jgi:nitrite reductase/ring-hydroxylating ferredoxin subunit
MPEERWFDLGAVEELRAHPLRQVTAGRVRLALSYKEGIFGAISGVCNHAGGPLGDGQLDGEYVVCPWHHWKFHCRSGAGEPGFEGEVWRRAPPKLKSVVAGVFGIIPGCGQQSAMRDDGSAR